MARIELPREKKVKHLTLLREPRRLTPREFNALALPSLRWCAPLRAP
jgi:hypothetical protein